MIRSCPVRESHSVLETFVTWRRVRRVDRLLDMIRTAVNVSGDAVVSADALDDAISQGALAAQQAGRREKKIDARLEVFTEGLPHESPSMSQTIAFDHRVNVNAIT